MVRVLCVVYVVVLAQVLGPTISIAELLDGSDPCDGCCPSDAPENAPDPPCAPDCRACVCCAATRLMVAVEPIAPRRSPVVVTVEWSLADPLAQFEPREIFHVPKLFFA